MYLGFHSDKPESAVGIIESERKICAAIIVAASDQGNDVSPHQGDAKRRHDQGNARRMFVAQLAEQQPIDNQHHQAGRDHGKPDGEQ